MNPRILFVCYSNINRSAAAEIICRYDYPDLQVLSAGVSPSPRIDKITAPRMRKALAIAGYETLGILSKAAKLWMIEWADYVFYMDNSNYLMMTEQFGQVQKAHLLSSVIGVDRIPDPRYAKGVESDLHVIRLIKDSMDIWVKQIRSTHHERA